jgi:hypothetical protein
MPRSGDRQIDADERIERRVQLWMRAYPRRWRQERAEELSGLVVDLAGPDARRLGVNAGLDLVRGGWATRWREHPPLHTWLLYRLFDRRIPAAYRSSLVVALGLGDLGAMLARRRLDGLLGERPAQPWRVLRPIRPNGKARVFLGMLMTVTLAWLEVSGRLVLGPSVLLGWVALLLWPGAVVALMVTRRTDDADIAGADVWWIATRGRLPAVDSPAWGLRPLPGEPSPEVRNGAVHG